MPIGPMVNKSAFAAYPALEAKTLTAALGTKESPTSNSSMTPSARIVGPRFAPLLTFIHSVKFREICSTPYADAGGLLSLEQVVGVRLERWPSLHWNAWLYWNGIRTVFTSVKTS